MSDDRPGNGVRPAGSLTGPRVVALVLLGLGAAFLYQALQIRTPQAYSPIGPRFVPMVVTIGLLAFAAILLIRTTWLRDRELAVAARDQDARTHWPTVALVGVALVSYAVALAPLGYLVATAIFVPAAARILGSRSVLVDALIGVVLAVAIYFGFTEFLGVRLPAGVLDVVL